MRVQLEGEVVAGRAHLGHHLRVEADERLQCMCHRGHARTSNRDLKQRSLRRGQKRIEMTPVVLGSSRLVTALQAAPLHIVMEKSSRGFQSHVLRPHLTTSDVCQNSGGLAVPARDSPGGLEVPQILPRKADSVGVEVKILH